jgi:FixJ family two-component response regulator
LVVLFNFAALLWVFPLSAARRQMTEGIPGDTVFIVDDDPDVLTSLRFLLETEGFRVQAFASGSDLLSTSLRGPFDCLIIDYKLKGMDGLKLVSELRARNVSSPVILITVYEEVLAKARAADIRHILLKPHINDNLVALVLSAMKAARA